jgi:hypothetical protein
MPELPSISLEKSTQASEKPATLSSARPERRQSRRAGVSLVVRIRTVDFHDGNFEEVRTTLNASRKSVYFFTRADRYYKGMRLRITSPYNPGVTELEQTGEVTRVQRLPDGYGIAVALLPTSSAISSRPPAANVHAQSSLAETADPFATPTTRSEAERRCASRTPFIAPIELIDMRTGSRIQARISDLSLRGCYVDTLNPLPVDSAVRLQIRRREELFDALARVSSSHAGSGMGLVFADLSLAQRTTLYNWLGDSALPPEAAAFSPHRAPQKRRQPTDVDQLYAVRLIHALVRKGLLSASEASELLSDPDME